MKYPYPLFLKRKRGYTRSMQQPEELFAGFGWKVQLEQASLPDGRLSKAVRIHRCDSVDILALTANRSVLLLREYRPFYGTSIWKLPGGKMDKESDSADAAQRELQEETGFGAQKLEHWFSANISESIAITNHFFLAEDLYPQSLPQDLDESIEVHKLPLSEAIDNVLSSDRVHLQSAVALLRFAREHP